jgi:DNA-binding transcriptional MerR regulator
MTAGASQSSVVQPSPRGGEKSPSAFRTISEVANELNIPQHVLRFWESKFNQIKPMKRGGGRRYYRPEDIGLLRSIRDLLYHEGYTIKGVQRLLREGGAKSLVENQEMAGALSSPAAVTSAAGIHAELRELLKELEALRSLLGKI